jgi:SnoaL-like domain
MGLLRLPRATLRSVEPLMLLGVLIAGALIAIAALRLLQMRSGSAHPAGPPVVIASIYDKPESKASTGLVSIEDLKTATNKPGDVAAPAVHETLVIVGERVADKESAASGAVAARPFRASELEPVHTGESGATAVVDPSDLQPPPEIDVGVTAPAASLDSYLIALSANAPGKPPSSPKPTIAGEWDRVVAALQRYSRAWNTRDLAEIIAVRPGLSRRTVRDELANVSKIEMNIRPVGTPRIHGDVAFVECEHHVSETFQDGVRKHSPAVRLTYVLERFDADWLITDAKILSPLR